MQLKQEITIVNTDAHNIDLESLKQLAANPKISAEIQGSGAVYICFRDSDRR